jgi:hypothetical protein
MSLAGAFFFTVPGPKMIWQFGELGYDYSIDYDCRVCNKPIRWDYYDTGMRRWVYQLWSALIDLKKNEPAFRSDDFTLSVAGAAKRIEINHESMDVRIIGNFDVAQQSMEASFSQTGWWYDYFSGDSLEVSDLHMQLSLEPGAFNIYTSVRLTQPDITASVPGQDLEYNAMQLYPNPFVDVVYLEPWESESQLSVCNLAGMEIFTRSVEPFVEQIDLSELPEGIHILTRRGAGKNPSYAKMVKLAR